MLGNEIIRLMRTGTYSRTDSIRLGKVRQWIVLDHDYKEVTVMTSTEELLAIILSEGVKITTANENLKELFCE